MLKKITALGAITLMMSSFAQAKCDLDGGNVSILGNDFPAIQAVAAAAKSCTDGTVITNLNKDYKEIMVPALTTSPSKFTATIANNGVLVTLMKDNLVRPLDSLIDEYGSSLQDSQKITVDGEVMAVAFMANAQHLFVRKDILKKAGINYIPATYEEVLDAANKVRKAGLMQYPVALNTKPGWNLGEEFINMYMGTGAELFKPGSAELNINNINGIKTLRMLRALVNYSNPDYLTFDSNATQAAWEAGDLALATMWGSRGGAILDDEGSSKTVRDNTVLVSAPAWGNGDVPASTLWWDGFTIAANASDEDAEATFKALMHGISKNVVRANNDDAVWLSAAYRPSAASAGVAATAKNGANPYPMLPFMGTLHTSLGAEIADYLQGKETAKQALNDVQAAYNAAAKEQGLL